MIYGGLGNDFMHGGEGDDAISGGEALAAYYTTDPLTTLAAYYVEDNLLQFGFKDPEEFRYYNGTTRCAWSRSARRAAPRAACRS